MSKNVDTVLVIGATSGLGETFAKHFHTQGKKDMASEITTNLTATIAVAHIIIPHFLALKRPTTFMTVSSAAGFVPHGLFPVYCATKAGVHAFTCSLRAELVGKNARVLELAPPGVATDLVVSFKEQIIEAMGGPEKFAPPMSLEEYMNGVIEEFEKEGEEEGAKEVAVGFARILAGTWREALGPILESMGTSG
ncbi:uncharacterized protein PAC_15691 [Phialocephala subalpina]|uniref:Uncharacterized protein n=1 Tax=Phialocephala subalpina TaxID=576137 RepID=A0A1L7XL51_9HELO|nr:uncharacterized protein PAC_15691 [Phialocephala subalpina]